MIFKYIHCSVTDFAICDPCILYASLFEITLSMLSISCMTLSTIAFIWSFAAMMS